MSERKTIIRTVGLKKHYTVGGNTVRALDGVDIFLRLWMGSSAIIIMSLTRTCA